MRQDWEPFLSLDKADGERPGEMCDLGTVLASHSMVAWIDGYEFRGTARLPVVALEVSHDGIRWHQLGRVGVGPKERVGVGLKEEISSYPSPGAETAPPWPARYVRARITAWPREVTAGLVSATVASA